MRARSGHEQAEVFDEALLAAAHLPPRLDLSEGRIFFFWQMPHPHTLARLRARHPRVPMLIGRYVAETPLHEAGLDYFCPTDFLSLRTLVDLEIAALHARQHWTGEPPPEYLGMPLVDGDLPRARFWNEALPAAAVLAFLARVRPGMRVTSDWLGARFARAAGLKVSRLPWGDLRDANWPPRRWLRERRLAVWRGARHHHGSRANTQRTDVDVVFALAGWVEDRMLAGFPIEEMLRAGHRCQLWVHRHTASLYALIAGSGVAYRDWPYPSPARDAAALQNAVRNWCRHAARHGYFAPLRGALAETLVDLMAWPRWAPKLVSMQRLVMRWLQKSRPRLLMAPAEKDWGPYCALYAARHLGIPTVGIKHATWPPGSYLEQFDDWHYFPTAADHVLAYTPMDAQVRTQSTPSGRRIVQWHGNPRLEKSMIEPGSHPRPLRLLIGASGAGAGRAMSLRCVAIRQNIRLIDALYQCLGDRISVRLHAWDSREQYPAHFRRLILPPDEALGRHLAGHAALVATYSTIAFDAAAAGLPVFFWDYGRLDMDRSEIAVRGGGVVAHDLDALCMSAARFLDDPLYHAELQKRALAFRAQLSHPAAERLAWLEAVRQSRPPTTLPAVVSDLVDVD